MKKTVELIFLVWEAGGNRKHLSAHSYRCFAALHAALFVWNFRQQPAVIHYLRTFGISLSHNLRFWLDKKESFLIYLRTLFIVLQYVTPDSSTAGNSGAFHSVQKSFYIGWLQPFLLLPLINILCLAFEPCISQSPGSF